MEVSSKLPNMFVFAEHPSAHPSYQEPPSQAASDQTQTPAEARTSDVVSHGMM